MPCILVACLLILNAISLPAYCDGPSELGDPTQNNQPSITLEELQQRQETKKPSPSVGGMVGAVIGAPAADAISKVISKPSPESPVEEPKEGQIVSGNITTDTGSYNNPNDGKDVTPPAPNKGAPRQNPKDAGRGGIILKEGQITSGNITTDTSKYNNPNDGKDVTPPDPNKGTPRQNPKDAGWGGDDSGVI